MSAQDEWILHVVRTLPPSPAQLADYLYGLRERDEHRPTQAALAARFGVSVRTIQRWLEIVADAAAEVFP